MRPGLLAGKAVRRDEIAPSSSLISEATPAASVGPASAVVGVAVTRSAQEELQWVSPGWEDEWTRRGGSPAGAAATQAAARVARRMESFMLVVVSSGTKCWSARKSVGGYVRRKEG